MQSQNPPLQPKRRASLPAMHLTNRQAHPTNNQFPQNNAFHQSIHPLPQQNQPNKQASTGPRRDSQPAYISDFERKRLLEQANNIYCQDEFSCDSKIFKNQKKKNALCTQLKVIKIFHIFLIKEFHCFLHLVETKIMFIFAITSLMESK